MMQIDSKKGAWDLVNYLYLNLYGLVLIPGMINMGGLHPIDFDMVVFIFHPLDGY